MSTSPILPTVGVDHWPCRILSPGEPSSHATLPVSLFTAMIAGARGEGMLTWLSSWPLDVLTKIRSPQTTGEELARLCGKRADLLDHVELPHDVDVGLAGELLVGDRAVVLVVVAEALQVHAHELGAVADVVRAVADDHRRTGHALERPVVDAARRQLLVRGLPQELAVGVAEGHDDAAVAGLLGIAHQLVVGAHQDDAAADYRVAVGLRARAWPPTSRSCRS